MPDTPIPTPHQRQVTLLHVWLEPPPRKGGSAPTESLWENLRAIVAEHEGVLVATPDTSPERLVACFGVPRTQESDPVRAVHAALAMQRAVSAFYRLSPGTTATPLRVGLSSGMALVSPARADGRYALSEELQEAARGVAEQAPQGGVALAPDSQRLVAGVFELKGRGGSYVVQGERSTHSYRTLEGGEPTGPFVGREAELDALKACVARVVREESLHLVTLVGEAGIGKSRLLYEFTRWLEEEGERVHPAGIRFFKSRANPQRRKQPYSLIQGLFAFRFGIRENDPTVQVRAKLEQGLRPVLRGGATEQAHLIGQLVGYDFSDSPYVRELRHDPQQLRLRAFQAVSQFLHALASAPRGGGPTPRSLLGSADASEIPLVILLLEDLHWADEGSLDLLTYLAHHCRDIPLLFVTLTRPTLWEEQSDWGAVFPPTQHTRLDLTPLRPEASAQVVAHLLGAHQPAPAALAEQLVTQADGNPLYLEELIKMLHEEGWLHAPDARSESALAGAGVRVPSTLMGVLQARLDALPGPERETLQRASIIGRTFWDQALTQVRNGHLYSMQDIWGALEPLQAKELIVSQSGSTFDGAQEYAFRHALLQGVVYNGVAPQQRSRYHAQVAAWLAEQSGERGQEVAGQIGRHYELAEQPLEAARWYDRAGERALEIYASQSAVAYYQSACGLLPDDPAHDPLRLRGLEGWGKALMWQARYLEALEIFRGMATVAQRGGDHAAEARSHVHQASMLDRVGRHAEALESAQRGEQCALAAAPVASEELAKAYFSIGIAHFRVGALEQTATMAEKMLALTAELNDRLNMARGYSLLGWVHSYRGAFAAGLDALQAGLALYRELRDRWQVGQALGNLGYCTHIQGELQTAHGYYQEAVEIALEIHNRGLELLVRMNLARLLVTLGELDAAERECRIAAEIDSTADGTSLIVAEIELARGRYAEAEAAARRALAASQASNEPEWSALALRVLGQLASVGAGGSDLDPVASFRESIALSRAASLEAEAGRTLRIWAQHEAAHGRESEAAALRQEALELFTRLDMQAEIARTNKG